MIHPLTPPWWQSAVIYQVYPRSFQDSDGDGVGDLPGLTRRLDYLKWLGVDALWVSPIYPSPMADFGYDVADYTGIDPRFGTLADFDALVARAHQLGLKLLLDFVPNHSSDQHLWFVDSRSGRSSAKRDWYIWRDPAPEGGPPNNWISDMGGPAWEWDAASGQYYYHAFLKEQPDLNWRNPNVRDAMLEAMRVWFDRGVDGFRVDVLWHMVKHADFPDNPENPAYAPGMGEMHRVLQHHSTDQPEVHDIAADMRRLADGYVGDRLLIGEIYLPVRELTYYYGTTERPEVHLPFNFQLIETPWRASAIADAITSYELWLPPHGWPNWVLGNHDRSRIASRIGEAQARVAAMLLLTLRGTPTLYNGDEIGLNDVAIPPERVQDPLELREPGIGRGRDPVRTPMPWDATDYAGFSTAEPWLPLNEDWRDRNVAAQSQADGSLLNFYRTLLQMRRDLPTLIWGRVTDVFGDEATLSYQRIHDGQVIVVVLNLSSEATYAYPVVSGRMTALLSTLESIPADVEQGDFVPLRANEGLILLVQEEA